MVRSLNRSSPTAWCKRLIGLRLKQVIAYVFENKIQTANECLHAALQLN